MLLCPPGSHAPGTTILLADGLISLKVVETTSTDIVSARVMSGGELGERKGINVPGVRINYAFFETTSDRDDILFGKNGS